ncbi:MAG TPA: TRAP transporter substrate-binding protein DctP [Burkholderiales bacterium]|nr:TRAP transporter substrate-binding protein DctP [Burkholderiales bacterium]
MQRARKCIAAALVAAFALPGSAAAQKIEWKFSMWGKQRAFTKGIEVLAERVEKASNGNFTIRLGYAETFSKDRENLDSIKLKAIDGAHFCNFYHPGKNPAFMVFSLPFLPLGDWDVSVKARNQLFKHPALVADLNNWDAMAYASTLLPQYEFMGKGTPPMKLADWKGKRVRAGGGLGDAMEVLGAVKTTTTATEVYTAMERGTMDAASFPYTYSHVAYRIHEIADWYTTNMSPGTAECPIVFSKSSWAKLPAQYQKLITDAKAEVDREQVRAYVEIDKKNLPMFQQRLKPVTYTKAQLQEFQRVAGKPVWEKWIEENKGRFNGQELIDVILKVAREGG